MLIGIGLGPGDPDLLTLKAVKELKKCGTVFVPGERSSKLVSPYCHPVVLDFPMTKDKERLEKAWRKFAEKIGERASKEKRTGFAVLGDPLIMSTFNHVRKKIEKMFPEIDIETVPGVSAFTASFSCIEQPVNNSFTVTDGSPVKNILAAKTVQPLKEAEKLRKKGFKDFVLIENLGLKNENITKELPKKAKYLSVLHGKKGQENRR